MLEKLGEEIHQSLEKKFTKKVFRRYKHTILKEVKRKGP